MKFWIFTVTYIKIVVFWDMTPCNLVNNNQYFGGTCCLRLLLMPEKLVTVYMAQHPEDIDNKTIIITRALFHFAPLCLICVTH
jgi:hypothetical protein